MANNPFDQEDIGKTTNKANANQSASNSNNGGFVGWWDSLEPYKKNALTAGVMGAGLKMMEAGGRSYSTPVNALSVVGTGGLHGLEEYNRTLNRERDYGLKTDYLDIEKNQDERRDRYLGVSEAYKNMAEKEFEAKEPYFGESLRLENKLRENQLDRSNIVPLGNGGFYDLKTREMHSAPPKPITESERKKNITDSLNIISKFIGIYGDTESSRAKASSITDLMMLGKYDEAKNLAYEGDTISDIDSVRKRLKDKPLDLNILNTALEDLDVAVYGKKQGRGLDLGDYKPLEKEPLDYSKLGTPSQIPSNKELASPEFLDFTANKYRLTVEELKELIRKQTGMNVE